jgi:hypothetical protein
MDTPEEDITKDISRRSSSLSRHMKVSVTDINICKQEFIYRVIHKSFRNFWTRSATTNTAAAGAESPDHKLRFQFCVHFQQRLEEDGLLRSWFSVTRRRVMCVVRWTKHSFGARKILMQRWNTSAIRLKWMCFLPLPLAKSTEPTVTGINYLDMLHLWLMPQLERDREDFILQQGGTSPHFHFDLRAHLSANHPGRWIGRFWQWLSFFPGPPRSPDLTPFLLGYVKDCAYVPPSPRDCHSCDKWSWRQSLLSTVRCCDVCGRNLITGLTSAESLMVGIRRTIVQVVNRWLPTAAARVRTRTQHVGFVVDKVAQQQVFSEYFDFPCQSSFHQILLHHNHPALAQ